MEVSAARTFVRPWLRNAGDGAEYGDARIDLSMMSVLAQLSLDLRYPKRVDRISLVADVPVIDEKNTDFAGVLANGFKPFRLTGDPYLLIGGTAKAVVVSLNATALGNISVVFGGGVYTTAPTVTVSGNATLTASLSVGEVYQINKTSAGSGYTAIPTITISDPDITLSASSNPVLSRPIYSDLIQIQVSRARTGQPCAIAFSDFDEDTVRGAIYPTPDQAYVLCIPWHPPLTMWTAGSTGTIPFDPDLFQIIAPWIAGHVQWNEVKHPVSGQGYQELKQKMQSIVGAGSLGSTHLTRSRVR